MESVAKGLDDTEGALWRLQMRSGWLISDFMIIWSVDMAGGPKQGLKWGEKIYMSKVLGTVKYHIGNYENYVATQKSRQKRTFIRF